MSMPSKRSKAWRHMAYSIDAGYPRPKKDEVVPIALSKSQWNVRLTCDACKRPLALIRYFVGPVYYEFTPGDRQVLCKKCAADRALLHSLDMTVNGEGR